MCLEGVKWKMKECISFMLLVVQEKRKIDKVGWLFFRGAHCFVISPIWTEMGGKESTNLMRSTILYNKMTNISLTLSKYMNFLITYKNTKVKIYIFPFSSFFNSNKGKIEFSHFLLLILSYIQRNVFFSLSLLFPLPFLFSFLVRFPS